MTFTLIAATDKNGGIGFKDSLPWELADDLAHFKSTTLNGNVLMGRKTYLSIPEAFRPLPRRRNIVLSRTMPHTSFPGCTFYKDFDPVMMRGQGIHDVFVIGGGEIYKLAFEYASRIILTEVEGEFRADTHFPVTPDELRNSGAWKRSAIRRVEANIKNSHSFEISTYYRIAPTGHMMTLASAVPDGIEAIWLDEIEKKNTHDGLTRFLGFIEGYCASSGWTTPVSVLSAAIAQRRKIT